MAEIKKGYVRPLDLKHGRVDLTHGSGGRAMAQLIAELFAKHLGNEYLGQGDDGAVLPSATAKSASFARPPCSAVVFGAVVSPAPTGSISALDFCSDAAHATRSARHHARRHSL